MRLLFLLPRPYGAKLHNAVAILSFLVRFSIFFYLDAFVKFSHVEILRVFGGEIADHVAPLEAGEGWLTFRLVSKQEPPIGVFAVLQVFFEHVVLLNGHLFVANWAHIVVVTVVDVCFIGVVEAGLECFPGGLGCVFRCNVFGTLRLVEDTSRAFDAKVLAENVEPSEN